MRKFSVLTMFLAVFIILAACSNSTNENERENEQPKKQTEASHKELEGTVVIDGSGTVYPLMAKLAEEYMINEQENVSIEVSRAGTSAGFKKFLEANGTDFNNASRQIKEEEVSQAEELGIEIKELKVALDGLTFVIHKENDWAQQLTDEQLQEIFLADGTYETWSDINADWPDEPIHTYGPNENHGTYEFLFENVLEERNLRDDINLQQEYSTLVSLIEDDPYGIAFFGFGYYVNNTDKLQAVHVDFGDGPVQPTLDTIAEDGDYAAFTRPVFTYLNVNNAQAKREVLDFAQYVIKNMNDFAGETGFAPIPDEEISESLDYLQSLQ